MVNIAALAKLKEKELRDDIKGNVEEIKANIALFVHRPDESKKKTLEVALQDYFVLKGYYLKHYDLTFGTEDSKVRQLCAYANLRGMYESIEISVKKKNKKKLSLKI